MRAYRKDQEKRKINQEKSSLEATVDKNDLEKDSAEVEEIFEDTNENFTKTFKHLGKADKRKF